MSKRIIDLTSFSSLPGGFPTGQEIAEISNNGNGSFQIPIAVLGATRSANTVSAGGTFTVAANNYGDVLVTTSSAVTVNLPDATLRNGVPCSVVALQATTPNITISGFGGQTLIGQASLTITNSYGSFTLWPISTGGWYTK